MMNSGTSTSMPQRIPTCPEIQPMIGSTISPGMTHSEATEKPVARARGGIASESATRMPGPSIASDAEITLLTATAMTMFGEIANTIAASEVPTATLARKRISPRMLPR